MTKSPRAGTPPPAISTRRLVFTPAASEPAGVDRPNALLNGCDEVNICAPAASEHPAEEKKKIQHRAAVGL